jgi:hypothetical protein
LITLDDLCGGRTKAMRLHYKIREGEESVKYCDICSSKYTIISCFPYVIFHSRRGCV